jgi:hypothetical protein
MKPIPQANYPIKVFTHTAENEGSELYDGIYGLRLNYSVEVCLCPRYDKVAYGFPPDPVRLNALHPMGEEIVTVDATRAFTLTAGPLVLLEQEAQTGQLLQRAIPCQTFWTPPKRCRDSITLGSIPFFSIASRGLSMSNTLPN